MDPGAVKVINKVRIYIIRVLGLPIKPSTAQEKTRQVLTYSGSELKIHFDPMGERKKEDDLALTLRNLSMSKTMKKSKEADEKTQLRLIEAHFELEKERKAA